MSRIRKFYETRFQLLARRLGKNETSFANACFCCANELAENEKLPGKLTLALVHAELRYDSRETVRFPRLFLCDNGLGGLARWLRAAGYEARWRPELNDAALIAEAKRVGATLITSDTLMMERGVLRDGLQPAICVPSSLQCEEQLLAVFRELRLSLREPRCMACGGELRPVEKSRVMERIPPRTARWLDEYFLCADCGQLFWRGTHWQRTSRELQKLIQRAALKINLPEN